MGVDIGRFGHKIQLEVSVCQLALGYGGIMRHLKRDEATARMYEETIQPDEKHHHELGRRLLLELATREDAQAAARDQPLREGDQLQLVRMCAADDCHWLFLDLSKNHSRRWCVMSSCGNRAKVRRFRTQPKPAD